MNKEHENSPDNEKENLETTESNNADWDSSFSMEHLPLFARILITDDGTDEPNNVLKYAISISKYTGAELIILRVAKDIKKIEGIAVEGSAERDKHTKWEAKGVMFDGFAHGLPFISSKIEFFKEFSDMGLGISVDRNPSDFSRALVELKGDYKKYKDAVVEFSKKLSWREVSRKHILLYESIVKTLF